MFMRPAVAIAFILQIATSLGDQTLTSQFASQGDARTSDRQSELDETECVFADSDADVLLWARVTNHQNCSYKELTNNATEEETLRRNFGFTTYMFDTMVSDKIGPRREIEDTRHEMCKTISYDLNSLPKASIVIVYFNEALSVLIRMINSIIDRTPDHLLHEILLIDDESYDNLVIESKLSLYGQKYWPMKKIKFLKTEQREGLIRAKNFGAKQATGEVVVFLDSHCEVNTGWLPPMLQRISEKPNVVVLPVVDLIHPYAFNYSLAMVAKAGFDWTLKFEWFYYPWTYFEEDKQNNIKPIPSPAMSGGLLAVRKKYFDQMGGYDDGMEIWGAENIEMSLRFWMCGGEIELLPCSRVGHVFRYGRPYSSPNGTDTNARNSARVVRVWFDNYQDIVYKLKPNLAVVESGDVRPRSELRQSLNCKDFQWYLDNIYPELKDKLDNVGLG